MIPESPKKGNGGSKSTAVTLILVATVVLVGVAAFGLGRLSATQELQKGLILHTNN